MSKAADQTIASDGPAEWILAVASSRDRACFIALFTAFAPRVKSYLLRHGVAEQTAEELAQETLLAIWRKADQFDPSRAAAAAWIYTIARNLWVDLLRHERHPDDGQIAEPAEDPFTPEQACRTADGERRLRRAIENLPAEQAEVLRLSFFEDRSHPDIASHLGVPLGTVKSRIRLATAHLRVALEGLI